MTVSNTDLIRVDKTAITAALAALAPTNADDLMVIHQGNTVMFVKHENVRSGTISSIASFIQIENKKGSDMSGSNLVIVTTSVWDKCLVFKSGYCLHTDDFTPTFAALTTTIAFGISVAADEDIVVIGFK